MHILYEDNFHKYILLTELKANMDRRTIKSEWEALTTRWYSQEWQVI